MQHLSLVFLIIVNSSKSLIKNKLGIETSHISCKTKKIKQLSQYQNWSSLQQQVFQAAIEEKPDGTWGSKFTIAARDGIFDAVMEIPGFIHPVDTPALFIQPEKGVNRQNWQIQPYKTNLKNFNLCQVPGNHWPFLTNPTEFNQTVAAFLASQT